MSSLARERNMWRIYGLEAKYPKLGKSAANPFIDPVGYHAYLDMMEKTFYSKLEDQKRAPQ